MNIGYTQLRLSTPAYKLLCTSHSFPPTFEVQRLVFAEKSSNWLATMWDIFCGDNTIYAKKKSITVIINNSSSSSCCCSSSIVVVVVVFIEDTAIWSIN